MKQIPEKNGRASFAQVQTALQQEQAKTETLLHLVGDYIFEEGASGEKIFYYSTFFAAYGRIRDDEAARERRS